MKSFVRKSFRIAVITGLVFIGLSIFGVLDYIFINPPITPLMLIRYVQHDSKKGPAKIVKEWKDLEDISPNMVLAVVSAEDNNFPTHFGVDWDAIKEAQKRNKKGKRIHGGSTITQQTAKNVFLIPNRSYIRKAFELYFTYLIELFWSKERIMEVYLNVIELGPGIYGVEAASNYYFKKPAKKLTRAEAALITTALPNPRKRNLAKPSPYMYQYQARVLKLMDMVGKVELD
ncbi:MAG TPA: monofunctional biosynthetic peptidoglycan transglycosylase [Marinilabiliales bacterium]|jgi:monofunctional biosynthetic peptidoglycan transglycosylase|nr:monofunctional biosynthetic peptidoglycan transglycosylase [Salinivirgaceae bacterium]OFX37105.1 MAG: monofunctional biosynthetic peptidoglycan transglycosylase [Bacteroidetes bacterium GWA2_40_14]OFX59381.1 MAG: monofunctional biosynthetic peptidoglycan transglycosylase [Bacteroidetes bacterium GWC2_40_13]OFX72915.1 MAG: monofunctional biosynthetic peptidoglycan transglycosylase [Bacteroidetes bacterium GWD2_40_43]OFX91552.1 MAG: monofunctional biosynthetic peptidoglycan transglycosylase [B